MLRNLRIERMKHWIVTKDHRTEHAKQHEKNDLNTEPWNLNNIKTWNLSGVRGCLASCLRMFVIIFSAISRGEDSSADGASSLWAHRLARWRTATHSGDGIGHIAGIPRDFTHCLQYKRRFQGHFKQDTFFWTEITIMYFSLIYTRSNTAPEHGSLHCQLEDYNIFFHRSSKVNWHVPPFLTLFDSSARKILFHTINDGKHPTFELASASGIWPSLWPIPNLMVQSTWPNSSIYHWDAHRRIDASGVWHLCTFLGPYPYLGRLGKGKK